MLSHGPYITHFNPECQRHFAHILADFTRRRIGTCACPRIMVVVITIACVVYFSESASGNEHEAFELSFVLVAPVLSFLSVGRFPAARLFLRTVFVMLNVVEITTGGMKSYTQFHSSAGVVG